MSEPAMTKEQFVRAEQELTRKILQNPRVKESFEMMAEQLRATPGFVPASEDEYNSVLEPW